MSGIRVTARDCTAAGYCLVPGVRDALKQHGMDFRDFVRNGIPIEDWEAVDDGQFQRVAEIARARAGDVEEEE